MEANVERVRRNSPVEHWRKAPEKKEKKKRLHRWLSGSEGTRILWSTKKIGGPIKRMRLE